MRLIDGILFQFPRFLWMVLIRTRLGPSPKSNSEMGIGGIIVVSIGRMAVRFVESRNESDMSVRFGRILTEHYGEMQHRYPSTRLPRFSKMTGSTESP